MRSLRFLLSRRWLLFALVVVLLAYATWWLGEWQFHRLADRKQSNAIISTNESRDPAPVADVLSPGRPVSTSDEWRVVTATGTYDSAETVVVRYRTRDGESGIDVVVPLVTADGTAVLVDRGWMPSENQGEDPTDVPDPPSGKVTVTGWVRVDATDSAEVSDHSTRAISSVEIARTIDQPVYGGFVDLKTESPAPAQPLESTELPELDNGPHFFYGLQWWFFGVLAVFGFFYLLYDEWRSQRSGETSTREEVLAERKQARADKDRRKQAVRAAYERERQKDPRVSRKAQSERSMPPSTGTIAPETNDAAGESRKAATRPNSSGSP
ncbi:SURF1 family cytochrome oxidase biogenesis protein [Nocardioides ungokensis]|uniref:SURF1 family cytochrome oxidase biogenesis protein n=1 Tax=Nocardioides ungokensis TaxID=1643322 RepID=UPI0015DDD46D|nr:SURF1 family protein [Nocardioides ungokensis]